VNSEGTPGGAGTSALAETAAAQPAAHTSTLRVAM
jgi:hypothetical protein